MDWLTFIAEITKALSWPLAVVVSVVILRGHLRGALPFLRKLKYKDVELEFAEKIKELDSAINKELPSSPDIDLDQATALDRFIQLAQISPRAAIFEAWREVEAAVINSAKSNIEKLQPEIDRWKSRLKIDTGQVTDFDLIRAFDRSDLLDPEMRELYRALRGLRNRALHHDERQIEVDVAIEYGAMAYRIAKFIQSTCIVSNNALQSTQKPRG